MKVDARWRGRGLSQPPSLRLWAGRVLSGIGFAFRMGYEELWTSCIGLPSQPKQALSLPIKGPAYGLADLPAGEAGACGASINEIGLKIPVPGRGSEAK